MTDKHESESRACAKDCACKTGGACTCAEGSGCGCGEGCTCGTKTATAALR